eukprot:jgi/Bigna1/75677/fgenesh1_pg.36_\
MCHTTRYAFVTALHLTKIEQDSCSFARMTIIQAVLALLALAIEKAEAGCMCRGDLFFQNIPPWNVLSSSVILDVDHANRVQAAKFAEWYPREKYGINTYPTLFSNDSMELTANAPFGGSELYIPGFPVITPKDYFDATEAELLAGTNAVVGAFFSDEIDAMKALLSSRQTLQTTWSQNSKFSRKANYMVNYIRRGLGLTHCSLVVDLDDDFILSSPFLSPCYSLASEAAYFIDSFVLEARRENLTLVRVGTFQVTHKNLTGLSSVQADILLNSIKRSGFYGIALMSYTDLNALGLMKEAAKFGLTSGDYQWIGTTWTLLANRHFYKNDPFCVDIIDGRIHLCFLDFSHTTPRVEWMGRNICESGCLCQESDQSRKAYLETTGDKLRNADSIRCLYQLWEVSYSEFGFGIAPPPSGYSKVIQLAFEATFAAAHAVSVMADAVDECNRTSDTIPSPALCSQLMTLPGRRKYVLTAYNTTGYTGMMGYMKPNGYENERDYDVINLRSEYLREAANGERLRKVVGVIAKNSKIFTPTGVTYFRGGSTSPPKNSVPRPKEDKQRLGRMSYVGITAFVLFVITDLCFFAWTFINQELPVIKASQPLFLFQVLVGSLLSSAVIPLAGLDDAGHSDRELKSACTASLWLYGIGFAVTLTALTIKLWKAKETILKTVMTLHVGFAAVYENSKIQHEDSVKEAFVLLRAAVSQAVVIPNWQIMLMMLAGITIEVLIIGIWNSFNGIFWTRSQYASVSYNASIIKIALFAYLLGSTSVGNAASYRRNSRKFGKKINMEMGGILPLMPTPPADSRNVPVSYICFPCSFSAIIPNAVDNNSNLFKSTNLWSRHCVARRESLPPTLNLLYMISSSVLVAEDPVTSYILKVFFILLNEFSVIGALFLPKIVAHYWKVHANDRTKAVLAKIQASIRSKNVDCLEGKRQSRKRNANRSVAVNSNNGRRLTITRSVGLKSSDSTCHSPAGNKMQDVVDIKTEARKVNLKKSPSKDIEMLHLNSTSNPTRMRKSDLNSERGICFSGNTIANRNVHTSSQDSSKVNFLSTRHAVV